MMTTTMPDDLYERYLLFTEEHKKASLPSLRDKKYKDLFVKVFKAMSRRAFNRSLAKMEPKERADFEQELQMPHQQLRKKWIAEAERAAHDFETDPKVRARVRKEVEAALAKGLTTKER